MSFCQSGGKATPAPNTTRASFGLLAKVCIWVYNVCHYLGNDSHSKVIPTTTA
jgi:hypothetical protein